MKKLIFILLLAMPLTGYTQYLDGFWGLKFYMNEQNVKDMVKMRTGKMPEEGSGIALLAYKNCNFGSYKAYLVQLVFQGDQLYGGDIFISPGQDNVLNAYNEIVDEISQKYKQPVIEKDMNGFTATWSPATASKNSARPKIAASIDNNVIRITYRDGQIYNQLLSSIKSYSSSDY